MPTLTGGCKIICRKRFETGEIVLRRVHPLECVRLQGWDLAMWSPEIPPVKALGGPWGLEEL